MMSPPWKAAQDGRFWPTTRRRAKKSTTLAQLFQNSSLQQLDSGVNPEFLELLEKRAGLLQLLTLKRRWLQPFGSHPGLASPSAYPAGMETPPSGSHPGPISVVAEFAVCPLGSQPGLASTVPELVPVDVMKLKKSG